MDGIDRDHFLDYSAKSKILHFCRTYPVVKVRPRSRRDLPTVDPEVGRRPAIRWSVASAWEDTDQGLDGDRRAGPWGWRWVPRVGPRCSVRFGRQGGGDEETRTPDPLLAKETLYQLSYVPAPVWVWWAFLDSNQRPLPYQGSALTS